MDFDTRFDKLNDEQRDAVKTTEGPLLVIAGPGTGKTELLSMRVANILRTTDTMANNILCLTYTEAGATAMRTRLIEIIGPSAYKVSIQTFHSFGTEIINQNSQYFYRGAIFKPADSIASYEILESIFEELDHSNPLSSKFNDKFSQLGGVSKAIQEIKKSGLTSDELLAIVSANDVILDSVESELTEVFRLDMKAKNLTTILERLAKLPLVVNSIPKPSLPLAVTNLADEFALSLARAVADASEDSKTTHITAWRNKWLEKNSQKDFIFKDRARNIKLRALAHIYYAYLRKMEEAQLYDYDDMILNVVHAMEKYPELKANLQEKYQYLLVDEFQDTNLAQMRILFNLTDSEVGDSPNIMAVGDDDQAIYSFQGSDINNIHRFRDKFPDFKSIVLVNNYRSDDQILSASRDVIQQAGGRLETIMNINKALIARQNKDDSLVKLVKLQTSLDERYWIAETVSQRIKDGQSRGLKPSDIAIIGRKHSDLGPLVNYLQARDIDVNYQYRDNVLELEQIRVLEHLARICVGLFNGEHDYVDSIMPEILAHPMFEINPQTLWRLSLDAYNKKFTWIETMLISSDELRTIAEWLIERAQAVPGETLEVFIDQLIGSSETPDDSYKSPYYQYYFGEKSLAENPASYLSTLESLRTLRTSLREYRQGIELDISDFIDFMNIHRLHDSKITTIRNNNEANENAVNLLSAHGSKGLEFDTVFVYNATDNAWGEKASTGRQGISYPENLKIRQNENTYDEKVRLFFVAMTRAKRQLYLSYSQTNASGKVQLPASFLTGTTLVDETPQIDSSINKQIELSQIDWQTTVISGSQAKLKELLAPMLANLKLSSTHVNNFIDLKYGGPSKFLINSLLKFPGAKPANASYGTAVHTALQIAHEHLTKTGELRPLEDVFGDFINELKDERLSDSEFEYWSKKGTDDLNAFLSAKYSSFRPTQRTEISFANQGAVVDSIPLTGLTDLIDFDDNQITVTDYKTGKPFNSWQASGYDAIKLHKYKQQLMFYKILSENSRDYAKYNFAGGVLQFVEPDSDGKILSLTTQFSDDEMEHFRKLIKAVWHCIINLEFPDISSYPQTIQGVKDFEDYLIDNYS